MTTLNGMHAIERKLMGHGGVYDELGQVATMLGTGHADPLKCGARVDAVRDAVEEIDRQHRGAVEDLRELCEALEATTWLGGQHKSGRTRVALAWERARRRLSGGQ